MPYISDQAAHYHILCLNIVTFTSGPQPGELQAKEINSRNKYRLGKRAAYDHVNGRLRVFKWQGIFLRDERQSVSQVGHCLTEFIS
jgi:hypothetical protein